MLSTTGNVKEIASESTSFLTIFITSHAHLEKLLYNDLLNIKIKIKNSTNIWVCTIKDQSREPNYHDPVTGYTISLGKEKGFYNEAGGQKFLKPERTPRSQRER